MWLSGEHQLPQTARPSRWMSVCLATSRTYRQTDRQTDQQTDVKMYRYARHRPVLNTKTSRQYGSDTPKCVQRPSHFMYLMLQQNVFLMRQNHTQRGNSVNFVLGLPLVDSKVQFMVTLSLF